MGALTLNDLNEHHKQVSELKRVKLLVWIHQMVHAFNLPDEDHSFELCTNLVDNYFLATKKDRDLKGELPLIGLATILIVSKYQENELVVTPSELIQNAGRQRYSVEQLFLMERQILQAVGFKINSRGSESLIQASHLLMNQLFDNKFESLITLAIKDLKASPRFERYFARVNPRA